MVVVPDSDIILIKSPLKLDNYNQLTFNNATDQYNYFHGLTHLEYDGCTYVRKEGVIRYNTGDNLRYEDLLKYNYCMYKNDSYSNKWFYAFITDCNYVNDGMSTIKIETDVFQTWQFDIVYKNSFIEREHVSNDSVGAHTLPENLEHGTYVINSTGAVETDLDSCYTCIGVTWLPDNTPFYTANRVYGGVFSGVSYLLFKFTESASKFVRAIDELGRNSSASIVNIFMIPQTLTGVAYDDERWFTANLGDETGINACVLPNVIARTLRDNISLTSPTTINGYTPKNNKLFTYPYNYLSITNNCGTENSYNYEDFVNNSPVFHLVGTITPSCSIMLYPHGYKKSSVTKAGYNWGIPVGKYPMGSWNSDQYTNWLTQNGINIMGVKIDAPTSQAIMGSLGAITSAGAGDYVGIGSGLGTMFNAVQEQYRHSLMSPTIGGQVNSGDITYANGKMSPTYYKMSIKQEYAKIIDDFFTMYGYKVNDVSTPNIHKRSNWDFMKTIDVNLEGDIPEKDLEKIRSLFNNGCTFWHTTQYYLDYTRTNSIL
nr:MAG TPA: Major tail protein [Caudoviricetes sp.]